MILYSYSSKSCKITIKKDNNVSGEENNILDYESDDKIEESGQDEEDHQTNGNKLEKQRKIWGGKGN